MIITSYAIFVSEVFLTVFLLYLTAVGTTEYNVLILSSVVGMHAQYAQIEYRSLWLKFKADMKSLSGSGPK